MAGSFGARAKIHEPPPSAKGLVYDDDDRDAALLLADPKPKGSGISAAKAARGPPTLAGAISEYKKLTGGAGWVGTTPREGIFDAITQSLADGDPPPSLRVLDAKVFSASGPKVNRHEVITSFTCEILRAATLACTGEAGRDHLRGMKKTTRADELSVRRSVASRLRRPPAAAARAQRLGPREGRPPPPPGTQNWAWPRASSGARARSRGPGPKVFSASVRPWVRRSWAP